MTHVESDLLAYLDGELSPADTQAVEAHVARCPSCMATLNELRALATGMAVTLPVIYESVHLPAEAEARIRDALTAERARIGRSGSLQQGFAGLLAGLQGALRPLSKATIPLIAVFFVVLSLNSARLPIQAGIQQTVVLGQDTLAPGSQAALRVVVRNSESNEPIANANVAVQLRQAGLAKTVYSGSTDDTGSAPVQFAVPADWQGAAELVVDTDSDLGNDQVVAPISLTRSYRLLLGSDKPVYQPGETLHLRTLALGKVDGKPVANATIRFEVSDPSGRQLLAEDKTSSEFGIASVDLPLSADAAFGQHQIRATLDDTVSELSVTLGQAPLPKFRVDVLADAPYYLGGDPVTGAVNAGYFYGRAVAGAPVSVRLVGSKPDANSPTGEQQVFADEQSGETDIAGNFVFQFDLPELPADAFAEDDTILLALEATVVDDAGDSEFGWQKLALASQPIMIDVVPEDGTLHTGVENILYVLTSYPDGQPAPTSLQVQIGAAAVIEQVTNDYGLAEIRFTPRSGAEGDRQVSVTATDTAGQIGRLIVALPLDEAKETLLLRTDRALYQVGDTLAVEAVATGSGEAVYLDVIKSGQTLITQSALVKDGKATLAIDLTPELAGALELNAYQIAGDDAILRDSRAIIVDAPEDLQVAITTDKSEYRPGDEAQVTIQTSRAGEGEESAIGLSVVNEAVYAQREYQPGFARAYFMLDKGLQESGLNLPGSASTSANAQVQDTAREAQQLTAKASWAGYGGQDYSLAARSVDQDSRSQVNQQRQQAFSRLSLWISLALILASAAISIIVVTGLRRTGVLGQAANRLLLTVVVFAVVGAALLFITQKLLDVLPEQFRGPALVVTGFLWFVLLLALLVYGFGARDQRAQYVALLLFAYVVLLALLAFAASQGATLAPIWLMFLAVGFGVLLAALVLLGWGLRAEGEKAAGLVTLLLTLLVLPLVVFLNTVNLSGSDVIKKIISPSVYGLNAGVLTGCAAPSGTPQTVEQPAAMQEARQEAPAATPEPESASGEASATVVVETLKEIAADQSAPAAAEPAAAAAVEMPTQPPAAAEEAPAPDPSLPPQPEVAAVEALTLSSDVITTTATPSLPTVTLTATQELTAALELAPLAISETIGADVAAASALSTTSGTADARIAENQFMIAETPTPTATVTLTPALSGELDTRRTLTESATATSVPIDLNDATVAAAAASNAAPPGENLTATPTPEIETPSQPTQTAEPIASVAPEPTLALPTDTPLPTSEPTPLPTPTPVPSASTPTPEVRIKQLPRPLPVSIEALPIIRERYPQTLYWNPEAVTNPEGRVRVTIPTGDTITTWRITAQAVDRNGKLGSSTMPLVVFQPLFLVPSVPAELSLEQVTTAQVQIFNYSSEPQTVVLTSQATSGLQLSPSEQTMTMRANDVATVEVSVQAVQAGPQSILWRVQGDGIQDARQVKIMVK